MISITLVFLMPYFLMPSDPGRDGKGYNSQFSISIAFFSRQLTSIVDIGHGNVAVTVIVLFTGSVWLI